MSNIFDSISVSDVKIMKVANGWVVNVPAHLIGLGPIKDFMKAAKTLNQDENDLSAILEKSNVNSENDNPKFPWVKEIYVFKTFDEVIQFLKTMESE